jgi:phosphonate transport system substrate-binding protein
MPYRLLAIIFSILFSSQSISKTLFLGTTGDDPDDEIKEFNVLATYLEKHLKGSGIDNVKTIVAPNTKKMAHLINSQKVDIYIDSPFPSLIVSQKTGSTIFLRRWKKGVAEYRSVVFSRKDSGIDSLEKMKGKLIAFEDPFSTSSFFLPKATLETQGAILKQVEVGDVLKNDITGYKFSDDDRNTMLWVLRKRADLGAMNERKFKKLAKKRINDLQVITRSIWVPRHVVSHSPSLDSKTVVAIKDTLKTMHTTKEGQLALKNFANTTKFDDFPSRTTDELMPLLNMLEQD